MPRKKKDRANIGEQNDSRNMTSQDEGVESLGQMNGMEADRAERTRGAGSHGDAQAGDEGVDDPAMGAVHRDDMTETPMQGDSLDRSQRMQSQRSERTMERSNDERWDDASDFSGRGDQKEGSSDAEGTGYTK